MPPSDAGNAASRLVNWPGWTRTTIAGSKDLPELSAGVPRSEEAPANARLPMEDVSGGVRKNPGESVSSDDRSNNTPVREPSDQFLSLPRSLPAHRVLISGHARERWIERALADVPLEEIEDFISAAIRRGHRIEIDGEPDVSCIMYRRYSMLLRSIIAGDGEFSVCLVTVLPKGERPVTEVGS